MTTWNEFRPQSTLLNPNFDGYRLSLDPLAQYLLKFDESIRVQKPLALNNEHYTLNAIKGFQLTNQLYINRWKEDHELYFFDQTHAIQRITISSSDSLSNLQQPIRVYQLPSNTLQGSLIFISETLALVCDGCSKLYLLDITQKKWKLIHEQDLDEFSTSPIQLLHSTGSQTQIHALVGFIQTDCQMLWVTLSLDSNHEWKFNRRRLLQGKKWPEFVTFEPEGQSLYIASEGIYKFTFDSLIEVKPEEPVAQPILEKIDSNLKYTWSQTHDSIDIEIESPNKDQEHQWSVKIESNRLTCLINNELLIDATLFESVNEKDSTYVVVSDKKNELSIVLQKSKVGFFWSDVFKEGRAIAGEIKAIGGVESKAVEEQDDIKQPYNSQQLEECDQCSDDNDTYLYRLDGETHRITHQGLITNQILFTKTNPSLLCIRNDVDGLIWITDPITEKNQIPWHHEATFNAFGYVQASKTNRKFISTPSDYSYAVIADARVHLYLYKQQTAASNLSGSSLRNRKTGKQVDTISKQYMISLENHQEIVGMIASIERIYVLLADHLIIISV